MSTIPSVEEIRRFFVEEYERGAREIETTDAIPSALLKRAAELGVYRLTIPPEYGGWGLSVTEYLPYLEAAAMGHGSGRMLMHLTNGLWRPLAHYGSDEQRQLVTAMGKGETVVAFCLTELAGGTGRDLHSRARQAAGGWTVTGEKHLITFADRADVFLLVAATDDRRAKDSLTAFLVLRKTQGFEVDATQRTMGKPTPGRCERMCG